MRFWCILHKEHKHPSASWDGQTGAGMFVVSNSLEEIAFFGFFRLCPGNMFMLLLFGQLTEKKASVLTIRLNGKKVSYKYSIFYIRHLKFRVLFPWYDTDKMKKRCYTTTFWWSATAMESNTVLVIPGPKSHSWNMLSTVTSAQYFLQFPPFTCH